MPIVWHVIQLYAAQGFSRFLLATGYRGELIERFAAAHALAARRARARASTPAPQTQTGGRLKLLEPLLAGERALLRDLRRRPRRHRPRARCSRFHRAHGALATMTVVRPQLQFGVDRARRATARVRGFREKPRSEHWVNGGFFCFGAGVLEYLDADSVLERGPLERLAAAGELRAHRHEGFWECMDTYKDAVQLNDLWASGEAPWKLWD